MMVDDRPGSRSGPAEQGRRFRLGLIVEALALSDLFQRR
jgi:hypothetical protein